MSKVISCHLICYAINCHLCCCCLLKILIRITSLEKFLSPPYVSDVKSMRTSRKFNVPRIYLPANSKRTSKN